jgi:hypothetical protein
MDNRKYDLEDRLVEYSCRMIDVVDALFNKYFLKCSMLNFQCSINTCK